MALVRTLQERGNSVGIVLPAQVLALLGWKDGHQVEVEAIGGHRILMKLVRRGGIGPPLARRTGISLGNRGDFTAMTWPSGLGP
jgi:antitoxin component of MazEF toxin-antitoxin module